MGQKERRQLVAGIREEFKSSHVSVMELCYKMKIPTKDLPTIQTPEQMYQVALSRWDPLKLNLCEEFKVCLLNNSKKSLGICDIGVGGIRNCLSETSFIIGAALLANASDIILLHNHPGGKCEPSRSDIETTKRVMDAAACFGIQVADHLIISDSGFYSFLNHCILSLGGNTRQIVTRL